MAKSVFFDSQIPISVCDGVSPAADWKGVVESLADFRCQASSLELRYSALRRSAQNFRLTDCREFGCRLSDELNKCDLVAGNVVMQSLPGGIDLTFGIDLAVLRKQMQDGRRLWGEELKLAKDSQKEMPPAELHAAFILRFDIHAPETQENIMRASRALDAAYCHLAQIHHQSTKGTYRFDSKLQDWIDN